MVILFRYGSRKVGMIEVGNKTNRNYKIASALAKKYKVLIFSNQKGQEVFIDLNRNSGKIDSMFKGE